MSKPTIEERAQALFRAAGPSEPLSPEALEAVWRKTEPKLAPSLWQGPMPKVLLISLLTAGAWWLLRAPTPTPAPVTINQPAVVAPPEVKVATPVIEVEPPKLAAAEVARTPVVVRPALGGSSPRVPTVIAPPEPTPDEEPVLAESRLLARAVSQLRDEHDAKAALGTLDEHTRRFSHGLLVREAELARVEALVAAGQRSAALTLLESMDLAHAPRGEELRVLEGELLAEAGRCAEALRELDFALSTKLVREAEERALYRRATCLTEAAQRAEFEHYLERFPTGQFSEQARNQLEP